MRIHTLSAVIVSCVFQPGQNFCSCQEGHGQDPVLILFHLTPVQGVAGKGQSGRSVGL